MPAYFLFDNLQVTNPERMARYAEQVAPIVKSYGGRYLALGGTVEPVEGTWKPTYPVLIEFPSVEAARAWYASDAYRELKALRHSASRADGVLIAGL
jgi:uncharacterized protein (DUF1330 family)